VWLDIIFLDKYRDLDKYSDCLKWAVASGSATAFSVSLAVGEDIKNIFDRIN
jgi:hypothetical protein